MGVTDAEVWDYSTAIREFIRKRDLKHISTLRIVDLLGHANTRELDRDEYLIHASCYRQELVAKFGPVDFNVRAAVCNDEDTRMTYRGYIKFLTKDLMYSQLATEMQSQQNPKKRYKEAIETLAYQMIHRGRVSPSPQSGQSKLKWNY